jgi:hypothetical protein
VRIPTCLLTLSIVLATGSARADDLPANAAQAVSLVVDFCGAIVGAELENYDAAAARVPGLNLSAPKPLDGLAEDAAIRERLGKMLLIETNEPAQFAGFAPAPSYQSNPFTVFQPDGGVCVTILAPGSPAAEAAMFARLAAPGSPWVRDESESLVTWNRPAPFGENVFLMSSNHPDHTLVIVALETRPVATAPQIAAQIQGAIEPCIAGIVAGKPAEAPQFNGVFMEKARKKHPENADVDVLDLRSAIAGPRTWLQVRSFRDQSFCELMIGDPKQPIAAVLDAVNTTVATMPGAKVVEIRAKGEEPAHPAYRFKRGGTKVDVSISLEDQDIIIVTVGRANGWWW